MTRHRRGSTKPLSFYGIKFKTPAATVARAKPLDENARQEESNSPKRIADRKPNEDAPDTKRA